MMLNSRQAMVDSDHNGGISTAQKGKAACCSHYESNDSEAVASFQLPLIIQVQTK
jgi:hypothetical protein